MSHFLSLGGRRSLPPSREMKNAKSLFLQPPVHGGQGIHDLTPVQQQHLLWPLCGERLGSKTPLWEQVAPSDPEAVNSGQRRRPVVLCGLPCSCLFSEPGPAALPQSPGFSPYCFNKRVFSRSHPDLVLSLAMTDPDWYSLKCVFHLPLKPTFP